jgi:archaellum component FlaC
VDISDKVLVLRKQREEISELKQANASAKGRIDAMKTHYHRLAKDTESQVNKLQEQLKGYEEAKKIADKDTQKRIVEANALKKKFAGAGELQKRIGELEKRCEGHKAVEDELERMKKELESEKKERAFLQRKVEDFETRTKQLENWEKIQEDLARALSARDEYKRRCQELEAAKSTGGKK